jgi:hypothetical protein
LGVGHIYECPDMRWLSQYLRNNIHEINGFFSTRGVKTDMLDNIDEFVSTIVKLDDNKIKNIPRFNLTKEHEQMYNDILSVCRELIV